MPRILQKNSIIKGSVTKRITIFRDVASLFLVSTYKISHHFLTFYHRKIYMVLQKNSLPLLIFVSFKRSSNPLYVFVKWKNWILGISHVLLWWGIYIMSRAKAIVWGAFCTEFSLGTCNIKYINPPILEEHEILSYSFFGHGHITADSRSNWKTQCIWQRVFWNHGIFL